MPQRTVSYPLGKREEPVLDQWRSLYAVTRELYRQAPWNVLANGDLFAVDDPVSGETGYCCVMGNGGMEFGMQVYLGDVGLRAFEKMSLREDDGDPSEIVLGMRCFGMNFDSKEFLDDKDLAPIKKLMVPFKGDGWPCFRSYNPGFAPWHITADEARFLTVCIGHVDTAAKIAAEDGVVCEGPGGRMLTFVHDSTTSVWKQEYRKMIIPNEPPVPEWYVDEMSIALIARKPSTPGIHWEVDCIPMMNAITDSIPHRYCRLVAVLESSAGLALPAGIIEAHGDFLGATGDALVELLRTQEQMPAEIWFMRRQLFEMTSDFLKSVGIKSKLSGDLKHLDEFKGESQKFFRRNEFME